MADYYPLLAKAVAGLPNSTPETRGAVYERARNALLGQLRRLEPPVPEADIERESQALEVAVARLEAEFASPPEPVEAAEPSPETVPLTPTAALEETPPLEGAEPTPESLAPSPPASGTPTPI